MKTIVYTLLLALCLTLAAPMTAFADEYKIPDAFPAGFNPPVDVTRGEKVGGFGGGAGSIAHNPIIFVHGNTRSAKDFIKTFQYFLGKGYTPNELWAVSYGHNNSTMIDSNDENAPDVAAFIEEVLRYAKTINPNVKQVDVISHSLGPTIVRKAIKSYKLEDKVGTHVMIAGANHGMELCAPGINTVCDELYPGSPWLEDLNSPVENPGPTKHVTIYDGTGKYDVAFNGDRIKDSPIIKGGTNYPLNMMKKLSVDHDELRYHPASLELQWQSVKDNLVAQSK